MTRETPQRDSSRDNGHRTIGFHLALLATILLLAPIRVQAQEANQLEDETGVEEEARGLLVLFPDADFYPPYLADPMRAQSALILGPVLDSEIPESGDARFIVRLGGRFPLFRMHPEGEPELGLQLDFEGGFLGHFDISNSLDNIGWDGIFGLLLTWKPDPSLAFRVGTLHDSAHVGDEYSDRTGRTRIGYTRQEIVVGASWLASSQWRVYAEGGYGFSLDDFQAPLRLQAGVEFTGQRRFWNGQFRWYGALDLGVYEESNWGVRTTTQLGIVLPTGRSSHRYRLALEYSDGRSTLGEFFHHEESYLGLGWYFDF